MIKPGYSRRSRRRRATFALFGRSLRRGAVAGAAAPYWALEDSVSDAVPLRDAPAAPARHEPRLDVLEAVARVQRDARADPRLTALAPGPELDRLIEETVRALWASSRVRDFVPLLALRQVREALGAAGETVEA